MNILYVELSSSDNVPKLAEVTGLLLSCCFTIRLIRPSTYNIFIYKQFLTTMFTQCKAVIIVN